MNFKNFISNLFFPKDIKCIVCDDELPEKNDYCICDKCLKNLPWNNQNCCKHCGNPLKSLSDYCLSCKREVPSFECAKSPFVFGGVLVDLLYDLKYNNKSYLSQYLSKILFDEFLKTGWKIDFVYPVPLFKARERQRGYNQSVLLSQEFKKNGYIIDCKNFVRVKNTQTQTNLTFEERQANLNDAFNVIDKNIVKGKNILLIDDVFTTGSTLKHCSNELINAGANKVFCLTLAHVENFKMAEGE